MRGTAVALGATMLMVMAAALWQGTDTFVAGWRTSLEQLARFLPILVIALLVAGFTETLLPDDLVERWLSDSSGWRGIGVAWLAGVLTPGGSIIGLPIAAVLYQAGVGLGVLMTYLTSLATLSLLRVPLEIGFYGWRVTGVRIAVSLILPLIAGGLTQLAATLLRSS